MTDTADTTPDTTHPNLTAALAAVQAELQPINKDEQNKEQGFAFRSIDAITAAVRPLFGKHGIVILPHVEDVTYEAVTSRSGKASGYRAIATVTYRIRHDSGDRDDARMIGEAIDYGDKSTSKAVQMAFKYLLTELLQVGSGDNDPDGQTVDDIAHPDSPPMSDDEIAERATNRLKADTLGLFDGDKAATVEAWGKATETLGLPADQPIPVDQHDDLRALLKVLAAAPRETAEGDEPPVKAPNPPNRAADDLTAPFDLQPGDPE